MGFTKELVAPCGINCGVCIAYLREKNKCCGCMVSGMNKVAHCNKCSLKLCDEHNKSKSVYCYDCEKFPCLGMKRLDKRYREKYNLSVIENLTFISQYGIDEFIKSENKKWKCKHCGNVLCVHKNYCLNCKIEYR